MSFPQDHRDPSIETLLSAVTDAILADQTDLDSILNRYGVPRADVESLVRVIQRLHVALVGVRPSRRFVARLRSDLMGTPPIGMIGRIRLLPPRVQIAAMIAVVAGFMVLTRRRISLDAHRETDVLPEGVTN